MEASKRSLYHLTEDMLDLQDILDHAIDDETGEIDDSKELDKFTAVSFEIDEKIQSYIRYMKVLEQHAADAKSEYKNLKAIAEESRENSKSAESKIKQLKFAIRRHMEATGTKEIISGPFKLKRKRNPPSVFVPDSANYLEWPDEFYRTEFSPEKKELLAAHKEGKSLPDGVEIRQSERLEVK